MDPLPPAPSAPPVSPQAPYTIPSYTFPQQIYQTPQTYSYPQVSIIPLLCQQCYRYDTYVTKYTFPCGKVHQVHQQCVPPYNSMCLICLKYASQQVFVENTVIPKAVPFNNLQTIITRQESVGTFQRNKKKIGCIFAVFMVVSLVFVLIVIFTTINSR